MVLCWGSELFSGLRSVTRVHFCMCFHHTNFVCGSAIQVGIVIAVHCISRAESVLNRLRLQMLAATERLIVPQSFTAELCTKLN